MVSPARALGMLLPQCSGRSKKQGYVAMTLESKSRLRDSVCPHDSPSSLWEPLFCKRWCNGETHTYTQRFLMPLQPLGKLSGLGRCQQPGSFFATPVLSTTVNFDYVNPERPRGLFSHPSRWNRRQTCGRSNMIKRKINYRRDHRRRWCYDFEACGT